MADPLELTLLLDYYGDLLPQKQRVYCDLSCNGDYSLAEIAEQAGISRQGVHDALAHAEASLREFERVLGCAERDIRLRAAAKQAGAIADRLSRHPDPAVALDAAELHRLVSAIERTAQ